MALADALSHIDEEIAAYEEKIRGLQHARSLLAGGDGGAQAASGKQGRRGRPKGSKNAGKAKKAVASVAKPKRNLSPEGRKAIAEAMKRRWAERRGTEAQPS